MRHLELLITLQNIKGVGRKSILSIPRGVLRGISHLSDLEVVKKYVSRGTFDKISLQDANDRARFILDECSLGGISVVTFLDDTYPENLREVLDKPIVVYVKGEMESFMKQSVAVIGTREPSDVGFKMASELGHRFSSMGYVTVSGLALGCDTAAHVGAMSCNGKTIAVMAHGLNTVYPAKNKYIADKIVLEKKGALVSEYSPSIKANRSFFVDRDRIQSGLSLGVVVVETSVDGGSMHTARFCKMQNKALAVCGHDVGKSEGNKFLVDNSGAFIINTSEDINRFVERMWMYESKKSVIKKCIAEEELFLKW